jgi:malate dehydrogenase (oxaloacetate-decarboxylating)
MRKHFTSPPPSASRAKRKDDIGFKTKARGLAVLNSPAMNKGTAFSADERKSLDLTGLLPPEITTLAMQVKRAYLQYDRLADRITKNIYLTALHDRNEVLFYRLFSEHLREMIPIVNDLTVGRAMEQYHHESRRPRGLYLSINHIDSMAESFANFGAGPGDVDLILATDAENILGIGDWGIGGIEVSIGKLAIYTAAGGIDPARAIPVMLDVGTNRPELLADPLYVGNRHPRIRGKQYDEFIDTYISTVRRVFPSAVLQWEDFAPGSGRRILAKYRHQICMFNDDMQGTGAITLAAAISAVRVCGTPLRKQRVVIFGAGTAGVGVADQLCQSMVLDGLTREEAIAQFWLVDREGLLTTDMADDMVDFQAPYARSSGETKNWQRDGSAIGLAEVIHRVRPTILIGASAASGSFTEPMIREMASHTERPIIFILSMPATSAEASPSELLAWTDGRVLLATGTASQPETYRGATYVIAQTNNALLYPGLVLGAILSRARCLTDGMFAAAASAVSSLVTVRQHGASLLPQIEDLRAVSVTVAAAVADAAQAEGVARAQFDDVTACVQDAMWQPVYRRIQAN